MGRDSDVGEDLHGTAPVAPLGGAEALLFAAADAGGDQSHRKTVTIGIQRGGTGSQAENHGDPHPVSAAPAVTARMPQAKKGEGQAKAPGTGAQWKDRELPALEENHAQTDRTPKQPAYGQERPCGRRSPPSGGSASLNRYWDSMEYGGAV